MFTIEHSSFGRPHPAELVSGDAMFVQPIEGGLFAAIIDALGHGPEAHDAACLALEILGREAGSDVSAVMRRLHEGLQGSRGAAAGLCVILESTGTMHYAGVGNTVVRKFGTSQVRLVSRDGVLGERFRTVKDAAEEAKDNATSGIVDEWTDQAEERAWFLFEAGRKG